MIHIIKMGVIPKDIATYRKTCGVCNTVYEFNESDVSYKLGRDEVFYYGYIRCPLCKTESLFSNT